MLAVTRIDSGCCQQQREGLLLVVQCWRLCRHSSSCLAAAAPQHGEGSCECAKLLQLL